MQQSYQMLKNIKIHYKIEICLVFIKMRKTFFILKLFQNDLKKIYIQSNIYGGTGFLKQFHSIYKTEFIKIINYLSVVL